VRNLFLSFIVALLVALPATARSEAQVDLPKAQASIPESQASVPEARPPVSTFRIPETLHFCGEKVPLERPDVRERLEREFYYLLDRQGLCIIYLKRADRTNPIVEVILELKKLPEDLKYVPVAESGQAVGYWQFMERTAKQYGVRVDRYVDERRDLTRSTLAAAAYLEDLYERYGSWPTALAGYNWGERNVDRAVREQGSDSYYDLYLPEETERYVFRILALKLIMEDPEAYSIHVPEGDRYRLPKVMEVDIRSKNPISVDILADCANVGARTIRVLNPWMRRNVLPAGEYLIAVPTEQSDGYRERVAQRLATRKRIVHEVRRGENLSTIASKYEVTVASIERWNDISRKKPIYHGQKLIIWRTN
jgi:hypothetical protein